MAECTRDCSINVLECLPPIVICNKHGRIPKGLYCEETCIPIGACGCKLHAGKKEEPLGVFARLSKLEEDNARLQRRIDVLEQMLK